MFLFRNNYFLMIKRNIHYKYELQKLIEVENY